jgi:putative Holliday junction resolvase
MRVLGLDLGGKRIGLAISDEEANIAFPAGILKSAGRKADVAAIHAMIEERGIGRVVIGLPRHLDGRKGPEAEAAERFAELLERTAGIKVETLDERWTSVEAERVLREQGQDGRKAKKNVDAVAASIILRTYLELRREELRAEEASPETRD